MEACILICNKEKRSTLKNKIIFINALKEVTRKNAESYLEKEHIEKIVSAYFNASEIRNFSTVASLEQIADYNYNLNISLYVNALNNEETFNVLPITKALSKWERVHADMTSSITKMFTLINERV
jgi:type I restriction enzyme M protein